MDKSTERRVFITKPEHEAYRAKWSRETGKCMECTGEGQVWNGWSKAEGTRYKPCVACGATGAAAKVLEGATA
jgi:hypothetical protein